LFAPPALEVIGGVTTNWTVRVWLEAVVVPVPVVPVEPVVPVVPVPVVPVDEVLGALMLMLPVQFEFTVYVPVN